jgi:hypothetical protein
MGDYAMAKELHATYLSSPISVGETAPEIERVICAVARLDQQVHPE